MKLLDLAVFSVISASTIWAAAADFNLNEVPPLIPLKLFVSKLDPNMHLLLARDQKNSNHYVLINQGGQIRVPLQLQHSTIYYDGGSADLYLETGERVLLPSGKHNYLHTKLGPTIIYPDKAPTPLERLETTDANLQKVGFLKFIGPREEDKPRVPLKERFKDFSPLSKIETRKLVAIKFKEGVKYSVQREIEDKIKALKQEQATVLERYSSTLYGHYNLILLVAPGSLDSIRQQIVPEVGLLEVLEGSAFAQNNQPNTLTLSEIISTLNNEATPLQQRTELVKVLLEKGSELSALSEADKIELTRGVISLLGDLDNIYSRVNNFAMNETAQQDFKDGKEDYLSFSVGGKENIRHAKSHKLSDLILKPIRQIGGQGYIVLDKINHPIARKIIIETADAFNGVGLTLLKSKPEGMTHTYFREWLDQQRVDMALVDRFPQTPDLKGLQDLQLGVSSHSGGIFENIKVSGDMSAVRDDSRKVIYFTNKENTQALPLYLLGLPGDKTTLKRELIQYIIEADKKAEKLRAWVNAAKQKEDRYERNRFVIEGDDKLLYFIRGMTYASALSAQVIPNFSKTEYKKTVVEIFTELLQIADTAIINQGTYVSIIEAATGLIREVETSEGPQGRKEAALSKSAVELQGVIFNRLLSGIAWMSMAQGPASAACDVLLSPNSWKTLLNNHQK